MKPARGEQDLPQATHEGVMTILGVQLRTYRLDDGRTVIHADDFHRLMAVMAGEGQGEDDNARSG